MLQALPKLTHPVYCKSMEKIVVSCTSISGQQRVREVMGHDSTVNICSLPITYTSAVLISSYHNIS